MAEQSSNPSPNPSTNKTNSLAIVSLVLAFFIPIVGLVLGIVALTKINKSKESGKGLAVAGIVVSCIGLLLQALVVITIVGGTKAAIDVASNPNNTNISTTKPNDGSRMESDEVANAGTAIRDGKFEFTVKSVKCGSTSVGTNQYMTKKAQGQYCLMNVTVKNIGDEPQSLMASDQFLFNSKGSKFSSDTMATMYASPDGAGTWYSEINPGNKVSGTIVFDLPKTEKPVTAELHDSVFSQGVKVQI